MLEMDKHINQGWKTFGEGELYLHRHDLPAGHMPHLLHHPVRPPAQLHYRLQVIRLHLKVLQERKARMQKGKKGNKLDTGYLVLSLVSPSVLGALSSPELSGLGAFPSSY